MKDSLVKVKSKLSSVEDLSETYANSKCNEALAIKPPPFEKIVDYFSLDENFDFCLTICAICLFLVFTGLAGAANRKLDIKTRLVCGAVVFWGLSPLIIIILI